MKSKPSRSQVRALQDAARHEYLHRLAGGLWVPHSVASIEEMKTENCRAHHPGALEACRMRGWLQPVGQGKAKWPPLRITEVGRNVLEEAGG